MDRIKMHMKLDSNNNFSVFNYYFNFSSLDEIDQAFLEWVEDYKFLVDPKGAAFKTSPYQAYKQYCKAWLIYLAGEEAKKEAIKKLQRN